MSVEQNIEDREWFDLMVAERGDRFWQLCHDRLFPQVMDEIDETLMDQQEVAKFEAERMAYGQYEGDRIAVIPRDYLEFIANTLPWLKKLNKYLKTMEIRG